MIDVEETLRDERALIGRLMLGTRHTSQVFQILDADALLDPVHRALYDLVFGMFRHDKAIDVASVDAVLPRNPELDGRVNLYAMVAAAQACPPGNVLSLASCLAERAELPVAAPEVEPVDASHFTHMPVSVPTGILVFPIPKAEQVPRCTAMHVRRRCNAGLYPGQWEDWVIEGLGYINAADGCEADPDLFLRQRCQQHLHTAAAAAAAEWEWFTPKRYPGLVHPHRNIWTSGRLVVMPQRPVAPPQAAPVVPAPPAAPSVGRQRQDVPTAVYWHYDAEGKLLYIGITDGLVGRGKAHAARSSWVQFAKTSKSEWHANRREAENAEKKAIEAERPLFNVTHNDTPEARARLVAYLVEHDRLDLLAPAVSRG